MNGHKLSLILLIRVLSICQYSNYIQENEFSQCLIIYISEASRLRWFGWVQRRAMKELVRWFGWVQGFVVVKYLHFSNCTRNNKQAVPVRMTSPSRSVMMELMWLMRNGILNIISLVEPSCRISPSTCGEANPVNLTQFGMAIL